MQVYVLVQVTGVRTRLYLMTYDPMKDLAQEGGAAAEGEMHTYWEEAMGRIAKHVSALWTELSLPVSHYFHPAKPRCQCFVDVGCNPASKPVPLAATCMRNATICQ